MAVNIFYLYFELAVYLAVMNGHYMLISTSNSPHITPNSLRYLCGQGVKWLPEKAIATFGDTII